MGQRYSVQQHQVSTILSWINRGIIAIPEIQRPFVWEAAKVRNLLDSLFQGFPVGYLIGWKNPDIRLKDGSLASGKLILIDGQQRVTALMAAMLGQEVLNKNYRRAHIRIAFHPLEKRFEVMNASIRRNSMWISDISVVFTGEKGLYPIVKEYCARNLETNEEDVFESLSALQNISGNQIGFIELSHELEIDTVTEIFIRVNSAGVPLNQADFAMSKISVNETHGGNRLRKAIDYFCHLAVAPNAYGTIQNDTDFASSDYFQKISWLRNENDNLFDPSYTDMLRVAFTSEFQRGRLSDLVALLSGRNFETRAYEEVIVEESFAKLQRGVLQFVNESSFKKLIMTLRSAGFVDASLIGSSNAISFAYILFLLLKKRDLHSGDIERTVRRWFVMSLLTARHSGSFETRFEQDSRAVMQEPDPLDYIEQIFQGGLSNSFWEVVLPQRLVSSSGNNQFFHMYKAAQIRANDKGFLSRDINVKDLIEVRADVHHIFPRDFLKKHGLPQAQYNQIANYVIAQSEINIAISNREPAVYFQELQEQVNGGKKRYGSIVDAETLQQNYRQNCIPENIAEMGLEDYPAFLKARRALIAAKLRTYFESL